MRARRYHPYRLILERVWIGARRRRFQPYRLTIAGVIYSSNRGAGQGGKGGQVSYRHD